MNGGTEICTMLTRCDSASGKVNLTRNINETDTHPSASISMLAVAEVSLRKSKGSPYCSNQRRLRVCENVGEHTILKGGVDDRHFRSHGRRPCLKQSLRLDRRFRQCIVFCLSDDGIQRTKSIRRLNQCIRKVG